MKYTIGIDFGTLSARALLVEVETGNDICEAIYEYPHGVMDRELAGIPLEQDWALEHPRDFLEAIYSVIPGVISKSGVVADDIIGVGVDFTSCTMLPVKNDGTPLCFLPEFKNNPHAYSKLWKHHSAEPEAEKLSKIALERNEYWISRYGGKVSSEFMLPKVWQILDEAPEVYAAADCFAEACDWIVWQLTGHHTRSLATVSFKAQYSKSKGFPDTEFYKALDPRLADFPQSRLTGPIVDIGERAGGISRIMAEKTGLREGTAVAVGTGDGYAALPALGITRPGSICAILGTSGVYLALSENFIDFPGLFAVTEGGLMPGYASYELGQSSFGDQLEWFVNNCTPARYFDQAREAGKNIYNYYDSLAMNIKPGASGLIALDWWNGNRSILSKANLTGTIIGLTLITKPEEIFRTLMEGMAFGARRIMESLETAMPVNEIRATGGIAKKSPVFMQIMADIVGIPIKVARTSQGPALGSAIFAAVAAGSSNGGYNSIEEASEKMQSEILAEYNPISENRLVYEKMYLQFKKLHDYFGRGENQVMEFLKDLRAEVSLR
jgi:L-ribulokinase